jgi:hypothetical protein
LLKTGRASEAEAVFQEDIEALPKNGWGLYGLHQSLLAQGKARQAREVQRQFKQAWQRADVDLNLAWY